MHKVVTLYYPPKDPVHFRRYYERTHLPLARQLPGLQGLRYSLDVQGGSGDSPYFGIAEAEFDSLPAMRAALASPEGQAAAADIANFATGGTMVFHYETTHVHVSAPADVTLASQIIADVTVSTPQEELDRQAHEPAMQTATIEVDYRYTREDLQALFDVAYNEDVERGGRYDARSGALNIYTHPWNTEMMRSENTLMGSLYAAWGQGNRIWQIQLDEEFPLDDLLAELGTLEEKALGRKIHGR